MRAFEVNCRVAAGTDSEPEECVGRTIAVLHTLHTIIHLTNVHIFHRQQHLDSLSHSKAETWVSTVITICLLFEYTYGEYSSMEFICLATSIDLQRDRMNGREMKASSSTLQTLHPVRPPTNQPDPLLWAQRKRVIIEINPRQVPNDRTN